MHNKNKINICIIPNNGGRVRTLQVCPKRLSILALGLVTVMVALGVYAFQCKQDLTKRIDQSAELESLRFTNASQQAQLDVFTQRVASLDSRLNKLKIDEMELASLTDQVSLELGVDKETPLSDLLPRLTATVAWANNQNGVGGSEQLASSLSSTAVAGNSRSVIKGMHRDLDRLMMAADEADNYMASLKENISEARSILAATPMFLPLERRISAKFGRRQSPFGGNDIDLHRGLDIPTPIGTAVRVPADGTVLSVGQSGSYGLLVTIDHGYGLVTRYAHLSESLVEPGATVSRGQNIALTGNSGRSTGPHLHYETVLGGVAVDPLKVMLAEAAQKATFKDNIDGLD